MALKKSTIIGEDILTLGQIELDGQYKLKVCVGGNGALGFKKLQ